MSEELFDVVFFGILQPGRNKHDAMQNMARLFKTEAAKLAPYFAGDRRVIKGKINAATAEKYREALENVGLVVNIEACLPPPAKQEAGRTDKAALAAAASPNLETASGGLSLAPAGVNVIENPVPVATKQIADISFLSMAEAGVDIIENPVAVTAREIGDISSITMAEAGSNILEFPAKIIPQKIDDISSLQTIT